MLQKQTNDATATATLWRENNVPVFLISNFIVKQIV